MSDLGQGPAEDKDVVDAERGDARDDRFRDDVGAVVRTADADFEDGRVHFLGQEDVEREQGHVSEVGGSKWRHRVLPLSQPVSVRMRVSEQ